jgi:hypothetical protein
MGHLQVVRLVVFYHLVQGIPPLHEPGIIFVDGRSGDGERKDLASMRERDIPDLLEGC